MVDAKEWPKVHGIRYTVYGTGYGLRITVNIRALGRRQNEVSAWPAYFFNHWPVGRPANGANPYTEIRSKP
jgi:hypothetical protein